MSRKVLITGGAGLIGQAIAKKHTSLGDDVFLYDTKLNRFNDYSNLIGQDITSSYYGELDKILKTIKPDVISHQAALVGVGQSMYDIRRYVDNNISFTGYLLQCLIDCKHLPNKFLFAGSMGPYGDAKPDESVEETYPQSPHSIYAVTKQAQENLLRVFSETYGMDLISLRYFSVYGTEQNPLNPYTGVLSIIANQCLNSDKISIYDDGSQTRDLIHIDDVADAHYKASNTKTNGISILNIGTGRSYSLMYIAEKIRDILSPGKEIVADGKHRKGDIMHMKADIRNAMSSLDWKPKHNLDDDIIEYCSYVQKNRGKFTTGNTIKEENSNIDKRGLVTNVRS